MSSKQKKPKGKAKGKPKRGHGLYRSGLERAFAEGVPKGVFEYEPRKIPYTIHKKYLPDFETDGILIECKGFFRVGDTQKYKAIRDSLDEELVFVLSDPNKKIRKGAHMTMGQWCEKEGFAFFTVEEVEELMDYVNDPNRTN